MPSVYIYQADVYCERCGRSIRRRLRKEGSSPCGDSDRWPQKVLDYEDQEADHPQHCGSGPACIDRLRLGKNSYGKWLENSLTADGVAYVREKIKEDPDGKNPVTQFWKEVYELEPEAVSITNYYYCPDCDESWDLEYCDSEHDDECPVCGEHYTSFGSGEEGERLRDEVAGPPTEPSPDDLVTTDYRVWREHEDPRAVVIVEDPHGHGDFGPDNWVVAVRKYMDETKFWPNCWFLGERGDWNLLDLETGGYADERKGV